MALSKIAVSSHITRLLNVRGSAHVIVMLTANTNTANKLRIQYLYGG